MCAACQHLNSADDRFCVKCGSPLGLTCRRCDYPIDVTQNYCGNCGYDLRSRLASPSPAAYTPPHLAQRILEERHLITGERKRVTVLFADIVGSTEKAAALGDRHSDVARSLLIFWIAPIIAESTVERIALRLARGYLQWQYLRAYQKQVELDAERLA